MKEARITCKTRTVKIADLDIDMVRGDVMFVPAEAASGSADLRVMQGAGAVEVYYVQRSRETRRRVLAPPHGPRIPLKKRKAIVTVKSHEIDEDALADKLMERLMPFVGQRASEEVLERMQATMDDSMQQIRQALQGTGGARPGAPPGTVREVVDAPEIAFIPKGIVGAVEGTVEVQEAESEGSGGVDDAAAALKAARKQKKETP